MILILEMVVEQGLLCCRIERMLWVCDLDGWSAVVRMRVLLMHPCDICVCVALKALHVCDSLLVFLGGYVECNNEPLSFKVLSNNI